MIYKIENNNKKHNFGTFGSIYKTGKLFEKCDS